MHIGLRRETACESYGIGTQVLRTFGIIVSVAVVMQPGFLIVLLPLKPQVARIQPFVMRIIGDLSDQRPPDGVFPFPDGLTLFGHELSGRAQMVGDDVQQLAVPFLGDGPEAVRFVVPVLGLVPGYCAVGVDRGFLDELVAVPLVGAAFAAGAVVAFGSGRFVAAALCAGLLDSPPEGVVGVAPPFAIGFGHFDELVFAVPAVVPGVGPEAFFVFAFLV